MPRIRTLIADDEPLARENLRLRLRARPDFEIVEECESGRQTVSAVCAQRPDVLFLDIQMPDLNGFEVIERIPAEVMPVVIFVTAYDRYALDAFRVHALDYLLKPFTDDRFAEALQATRARLAEAAASGPAQEPVYGLSGGMARPTWDRLVVRAKGRVIFLRPQELDWVEACGDYVRLHAGSKSYLVRRTMQEMESRLGAGGFVRVSRAAIVNAERIAELRPLPRGEFLIRLAAGPELKLTQSHRRQLESLLGERF